EQAFGGGIERFDAAMRIDDDDAIDHRVDDRPRSRLAGTQLFVEPHTLTEVVQHACEPTLALNRHLADRQVERERGSVAPAPGHLTTNPDDLGGTGLEIPKEIVVVGFMVRRRHEYA